MVLNLDSSASSLDESLSTNTPPHDMNSSTLPPHPVTTQQQHAIASMQQRSVSTTQQHPMVKPEPSPEQSNDQRSATLQQQQQQEAHSGRLVLSGSSVPSDILVPAVNQVNIESQLPTVPASNARRIIPPPLPTIQHNNHQPVSSILFLDH